MNIYCKGLAAAFPLSYKIKVYLTGEYDEFFHKQRIYLVIKTHREFFLYVFIKNYIREFLTSSSYKNTSL